MPYTPAENRYDSMEYKRCGNSGLKLPAVSLGLWHNFGEVDVMDNCHTLVQSAFDQGITHFDLANNYGPPPGSAEETFGRILATDFKGYRDELVISTKAGWTMWPGPYGDFASRKYMLASLDQSLQRMGLDYVDIFYSHRPDPDTPIEETMGALDTAVRQGKALYVGISQYNPEETRKAVAVLKELGTPFLIHQPVYNMFNRWVEDGLLDVLEEEGIGCIPFSPLAQGLLTDKYLKGIPEDSRAAKAHGFLQREQITDDVLKKVAALSEIAENRGQKLAQMALSWIAKDSRVTTVLIGASKVKQINEAVEAVKNTTFTNDELDAIEAILK